MNPKITPSNNTNVETSVSIITVNNNADTEDNAHTEDNADKFYKLKKRFTTTIV